MKERTTTPRPTGNSVTAELQHTMASKNVSMQINFAPKHVECKLIKKNWKLFSAKYLLLLENKVFQYRTKLFHHHHHTIHSPRNLPPTLRQASLFWFSFQVNTKYISSCMWNILHRKYFQHGSLFVCVCVLLQGGSSHQNFIKVKAFSDSSSKLRN